MHITDLLKILLRGLGVCQTRNDINMGFAESNPGFVDSYESWVDDYTHLEDKIKLYMSRKAMSNKIHSIRSRTKNIDSLCRKVDRKNAEDIMKPDSERLGLITADNIKSRITDISAVRILHLYMTQFTDIHRYILESIDKKEFALFEEPKAYTWDMESKSYFESLDIACSVKESYYTSVHYVLKPNAESDIACELQVRTLMEEVWGEVDHAMNYPEQHSDPQCVEQIKVLARIVGAGGHLSDSIMRRYA